MIDYEKIGTRIREERKYILKVSQEKMAEDLGMYQADISNLEKAKNGSGITDLSKLELIADYFGVPLEKLIFGREDKKMLKYHGDNMRLQESKKKLIKSHETILKRLIGEEDLPPVRTWECGPYSLHSFFEFQQLFDSNSRVIDDKSQPTAMLPRLHTYIFFGTEIIGVATSAITSVMSHVHQPSMRILQQMLPADILDVTDVYRTLNPYWALWHFTEDGPERDEYEQNLVKRMDELRALGEDRRVLYIENVYIREDCRQKGIFRMYIDMLKAVYAGCIMWLNMEPTSGSEMDEEYAMLPTYSVSDVGQMNINAAIAEKVGFSIDPDVWHIQAETISEDGTSMVGVVEIRKCAFYLPSEIRKLLSNDGNLVALGRAKQKLAAEQERREAENIDNEISADISNYELGDWLVAEWKETCATGSREGEVEIWYAACSVKDGVKWRFGYSNRSPREVGLDFAGQFETYDWLDDALESEYLDNFLLVRSQLLAGMSEDQHLAVLDAECSN